MGTLNLDTICTLLRERGIPAYVEQTGGGVATIYAGEQNIPDPSGEWMRWQALAGPGWFEGPGWSNGRGHTSDFAIGPDDDGETRPLFASDDWDETRVAEELAAVIKG